MRRESLCHVICHHEKRICDEEGNEWRSSPQRLEECYAGTCCVVREYGVMLKGLMSLSYVEMIYEKKIYVWVDLHLFLCEGISGDHVRSV